MVSATPLVSVVMNCYNSAQYLAEAIDSVYAQTFEDWEIIFFDNCSTDNSAAIARRYDGRLKYFRSVFNIPLGAARNQAMQQASGKYIAFLDCDDVWLPSKLDKQVARMEESANIGAVFSDAAFFTDKGRSFRLFAKHKPPQGHVFREMLTCYVMPMSTTMFRREALGVIGGGFDERFNMVEDADFFLRIAFHYAIAYVDEALARRRMHPKSWTVTRKELFPKEEEEMLAKFASLWPLFEKDFAPEIAIRREIIQYQYAIVAWEKGHGAEARARFRPYLKTVKKRWIPYLFSYLPYPVYKAFKHGMKVVMAPFTGGFDDQAF